MRPLLLTAAALLLVPAALAQSLPPAGSGIRSGGGTGGDIGESVAEDVFTGETVVVGTFEQTATFGPGVSVTAADAPAARSDAFVARYAADGTALWARRMGTDVFNDFGAGVALASPFGGSGGVYVSGYFTGVATFDGGANPTLSLTTRNDFDAFLAAYSPAGDLLWVQQAGGADQDTGRGVATDAFGRVYWTGSFTGTATWGSGAAALTRTSAGNADGFLARYTPDGTLDRLLTVGGDESDDLRAVSVYPYSSVAFATGTFRSVAFFGATPLQSRGLSDVALIAVDPDNTVAWARQVGGGGNDYARGLALTRYDGTLGVGGSFENTILVGTDVLTSAGFSDAFLALYSPQGDALRGFRGGGAGFDIANAVAATPLVPIATLGGGSSASVFVLTGYIDGASTFGPTAVAAQGTDAFAAVYPAPYDAAGPAEVFAVGGSGQDRGNGATVGYLGQDLVLTGSYRSTVAFGTPVTSAGGSDVFVARVPLCPRYSCLPTADEPDADAAAVRVSVAPNPSRRPVVTLHLAAPSEATVEVVDVLGRVVAVLHRGALPAGETRLPAGALAPGTYVVRAAGAAVPFVVVR